MYPLANDENGYPLEVPPTAIGWLVRRHNGGKGRPATIYADGRPLVVELSATTRELREHGCGGGPYRLEAVDEHRRPLGVVAFTELPENGETDTERKHTEPAPADAMGAVVGLVQGLVRTVEAMQRVQSDRERAHADVLNRLIERLTPPPPQPVQELRNALSDLVEMQRAIRKITTDPTNTTPAKPVVEKPDDGAAPPFWERIMGKVVEDGAQRAMDALFKKIGLADAAPRVASDVAQAVAKAATPKTPFGEQAPVVQEPALSSAPVESTSEADLSSENAPAPRANPPMEGTATDVDAVARLRAIMAKLTPDEERAVMKAVRELPEATLANAQAQLLAMPIDDAVAFLKAAFLRGQGVAPT